MAVIRFILVIRRRTESVHQPARRGETRTALNERDLDCGERKLILNSARDGPRMSKLSRRLSLVSKVGALIGCLASASWANEVGAAG
jgi:hypothetical protein